MIARRIAAGPAVALAVAGAVVIAGGGGEEEAAAPPPARPARAQPYRGEPVLSPFLEEAVARGNVVILHRDARTPRGTLELATGAPPELRRAGLAVLFEREPTLRRRLAAVGGGQIVTADGPRALRPFVDRQLGRSLTSPGR